MSHDRQTKKARLGRGGGREGGEDRVMRHVLQAQRQQQREHAARDLKVHGVPKDETADPSGNSEAVTGLMVGASPIHGQGVFSGERITKGTVVCSVVAGDTVTDAAARVNAADVPNTSMEMDGARLVLRATEDLAPGREVVANYPVDGDWTRHRPR